ncbi:hypothetical protein N7491_003239 [Penicillium cf. griseofulvum]|nr:hypothetical protein N7491_003239 [Penicillium cf. griseofulvum]
MDPFAKLPAEIILLILESCCDFTSLDGLQQISPRAELAFNASYRTVTEHVLKKCPLTSEGLHNEFTLLASIESTTFTPTALLEQLDSLSGAVSAAAKVHITACACLQHLFTRLQSTKPQRPIAPAIDLIEWVHGKGDPPSWIESYRTHRGLWHLELFRHIYNAASTRWSWSTHDLDFFAEQYVEWCRLEWGLQGIQTISECVVDLCVNEPTIMSRRFSFLIAIPSPTDLGLRACWSLPVVPTDTRVDSTWGRRRATANGRSTVLHYYNALCGGDKGPHKPLWKLDFQAFRRLGIPLWDGWRL